jgi:hypothetical protein
MEIKVRVFYNGKQVEPSELTIKNPNIDRLINQIIDSCNDGKTSDDIKTAS